MKDRREYSMSVVGTHHFVWTLLDFSMVLSMETKSLCMGCMDGYGLVLICGLVYEIPP